MATFTSSSIVPVCTLSTLGKGKGRIPYSQVYSISAALRI
jgi:hypothetical protein